MDPNDDMGAQAWEAAISASDISVVSGITANRPILPDPGKSPEATLELAERLWQERRNMILNGLGNQK